ncbi:MAG: adenosylcobinamide-GDP ribazoletransferase [Alphaproteobacteria bacterium]|nr:adenosylcobinamide-GDP ribazoletransferase [Alphaproteobacteria bacterium]
MQVIENLLTETLRAISFLSRLPVPDRHFNDHDGSLRRTVAAFPLAGLVIALPPTLMIGLLSAAGAKAVLVALFAVTMQIMLTGALHEDGLSDTADGLGGGGSREKALSIMKDSRIGTYGALALILSVAIRVAALAILVEALPPLAAALSWLAVAALSRTLLVWHWSSLPSARTDGVAASAGMPDTEAARTAYVLGAASTVALSIVALPFHAWFLASAFALASAFIFTRHCRTRLGGHTGDTIGASQQLCEIAFLITLAMVV